MSQLVSASSPDTQKPTVTTTRCVTVWRHHAAARKRPLRPLLLRRRNLRASHRRHVGRDERRQLLVHHLDKLIGRAASVQHVDIEHSWCVCLYARFRRRLPGSVFVLAKLSLTEVNTCCFHERQVILNKP